MSRLMNQPLDVKVAMIAHHLELSVLLINDILQTEVQDLCGDRYSHKESEKSRYNRWGANPGSVRIGDQKIPVSVPRVYDQKAKKNVSLKYYEKMREIPEQDEKLLKKVLYGVSTRDYEKVTDQLHESFGLSPSSVSRKFKENSKKVVKSAHIDHHFPRRTDQ